MHAQTDPYYAYLTSAWYDVVDNVVDWAKIQPDDQKFPVNVTLHARFNKNSQSILSPAYQPDKSDVHTCWIGVLSGAGAVPSA